MTALHELYNIYYDLVKLANSDTSDLADELILGLDEMYKDLLFFKKAIIVNDDILSKSVILRYASKHNYESGFFFKKNYDLDEGWTAFLDAYRAGKVKSLQEWVKKKRRIPLTKKKSEQNISKYIEGLRC